MGATFSRLKNWIAEILSYADLNAEIDNILNNLTPAGVDDYSTNTTQMRLTTDPGEVGTESLATSLAAELERIRFTIKEIKGSGVAQWYSSSNTSLTDLLVSIGGSTVANRISSGKASSNSNAPRFLVPSGTTTSITLDAAPTNLVYYINGVQYTATADVTFSGMSTAPTSNNTCLVNDSILAGQEASKWVGEDGTTLSIDTIGTEITSLINKYAGFKVVSGGLTEYFIGYVNSASITNCLRGCFYDQNLAAIPRIAISDNNTISLMGLGWMFANSTAGIAVSYINPQVSYSTPSATTGYWFDIGATAWKTYNGSSWNNVSQTLVGFSLQTTNACVGARCFDFYAAYSDYSNMQLDYVSATTIQQRNFGGKVSVGSSLIEYKTYKPTWDITVDRETGYGESASLTYFAYVGENGQCKLSPEKPYYSPDMGRGWYHPYENWRALASIQNNAASDLSLHTLKNLTKDQNSTLSLIPVNDIRNIGMSATVNASAMLVTVHAADGSQLAPGNPGYATFRAASATAGTVVTRQLFVNLNLTVPVGAHLGNTNGLSQYEWVYLTDSAGTIDTAIASQIPVMESDLPATTQLSVNSTVNGVLYSQGASASAVAVRNVGRITTNNATASSWVSAPTEVSIRPQFIYNIGNAVTNRTFTMNNFSPASAIFQTRRVGDYLECQFAFVPSASTASAASLDIMSGLTIDTVKMCLGSARNFVGQWYACSTSSGVSFIGTTRHGAMYVDSGNASRINFAIGAAAGQFQAVNAATISTDVSGTLAGYFRLPIQGWSNYGP